MQEKSIQLESNISASLTREDRAYIEKIDARLLVLLRGKHVRDVRDTQTLNQIWELVKARGDYMRMNASDRKDAIENASRRVEVLRARTPEGKLMIINLTEKMHEWQRFYADEGVDWVHDAFPQTLKVTPEQSEGMERLMEMGYTDVMYVPEGIVREPHVVEGIITEGSKFNAKQLYKAMTGGYQGIIMWSDYDSSGGVGASSGVGGARLLFLKPVKELDADAQYKSTIDKSVEALTTKTIKELGIPGFKIEEQTKRLEDMGLLGLDEVAYMIYQRKYFAETGERVDTKYHNLFPASRRLLSKSTLVPGGYSGDSLFLFAGNLTSHDTVTGCRLAGRFEL